MCEQRKHDSVGAGKGECRGYPTAVALTAAGRRSYGARHSAERADDRVGATLLVIDSTRAAVIVVLAGLAGIVVLGAFAMSQTDGDMASIATAAFGVIGSVVAAFFGVHSGASMARGEAAKTERMLVSMMDDDKKKEMNELLDRAARAAKAPQSERG